MKTHSLILSLIIVIALFAGFVRAAPVETIITLETPALYPPYTTCPDSGWLPFVNNRGYTYYLTLNVDDEDDATNSAEWRPVLPVSGVYRVEAYIPAHSSINWCTGNHNPSYDTSDARYIVFHRDGRAYLSRDQKPISNGWLLLGDYPFNAGSGGSVTLSDLNGEAAFTRTVSFSAMRFTLLTPDATETPSPTATITPTPTVTVTPSPSLTPTATYTPTITNTPAPPSAWIHLPLVIRQHAPTATPSPTPTITPTPTATFTPPPPGAWYLPQNAPAFDKCNAPALADLQIWYEFSPYRIVNLYIGGVSRACSNTLLTPEYIRAARALGWSFIPTWVGPQAPCSAYRNKMSADPNTAYAQGRAEADQAAAAANALGLSTPNNPTIIYYDLEGFGSNASPECRAAARAFINGWSERLHQLGHLAGGYGSTCGSHISEWASLPNPPDAIWAAVWYTNTYDPNAGVFGLPCLPDTLWQNQQRIRQYTGSHNETWGGVTFQIDSNIANASVAAPPSPVTSLQILMENGISQRIPLPQGHGNPLASAFPEEKRGYVLLQTPEGILSLWFTPDLGANWTPLELPPLDETFSAAQITLGDGILTLDLTVLTSANFHRTITVTVKPVIKGEVIRDK